MVNEPTKLQLTVGELRERLATIDGNAVLVLVVPPGFQGDAELETLWNVLVEHSGGPTVRLRPLEPAGGARVTGE